VIGTWDPRRNSNSPRSLPCGASLRRDHTIDHSPPCWDISTLIEKAASPPDASLLLDNPGQVFNLQEDDHVITIASAGCNVLDYIIEGARVTAVDFNACQVMIDRMYCIH
jgi:hypothetical protein